MITQDRLDYLKSESMRQFEEELYEVSRQETHRMYLCLLCFFPVPLIVPFPYNIPLFFLPFVGVWFWKRHLHKRLSVLTEKHLERFDATLEEWDVETEGPR